VLLLFYWQTSRQQFSWLDKKLIMDSKRIKHRRITFPQEPINVSTKSQTTIFKNQTKIVAKQNILYLSYFHQQRQVSFFRTFWLSSTHSWPMWNTVQILGALEKQKIAKTNKQGVVLRWNLLHRKLVILVVWIRMTIRWVRLVLRASACPALHIRN